jgi:tyrosine-protein phosphatase SIW14
VRVSLIRLIAVLVGGVAVAACASRQASDLPNFAVVTRDQVYRGGQPTKSGFEVLKKLGVRTVIKLDYDDEGPNHESPDELPSPLKPVNYSMPPSDVGQWFERAQADRIRQAADVLGDESNWPVYVHCLHGEDRTGIVVGEFRVLHDHWTKQRAYAEMKRHGFHPELLGLQKAWDNFEPPAQ